MLQGFFPVLPDQHALTGGEPIVLDDIGRAETVQRRGGFVLVNGMHGARRRNPGGFHDVLGEGLGGFQLRCCGAGPEDRHPGCTDRVGHACCQRRFRADDHQIAASSGGKIGDGLPVLRIDRMAGDVLRDTCVSRRGLYRSDSLIPQKTSNDGVLTAARTHD